MKKTHKRLFLLLPCVLAAVTLIFSVVLAYGFSDNARNNPKYLHLFVLYTICFVLNVISVTITLLAKTNNR